jgi:hypothetical protein
MREHRKYRIVRGRGQQHADAPHPLALLRARRERPGDCCAGSAVAITSRVRGGIADCHL